ncbi:hypothetical protein AAFO92_10340 [Roseovarius sp. CAU 1744]|uniref:hypothetical protein n=1 Tax=Roseovarius sp. CAU 1744 TaxID=3140368 RepID=UPI00325C0F79
MPVSAFDMITSAILSSKRAAGGTYSEVGVNTNSGAYLVFPATIPSTQHFLAFCAYQTLSDFRGSILGLENAGASDGWRPDDVSTDGFSNPEIDFLISGTTDKKFRSTANYAIGDRMCVLISGSILAGVATSKVVIWDETGGSAVNVFTNISAPLASRYDWDRYSATLPALFASAGGQRPADLLNFRFAYWDEGDLGGPPPEIDSGAVQGKFFNGSSGAIVDPAVSHASYGTPLYDIHGPASNYNNGTNLGAGSDWTASGSTFS